MQEDSLGSEGEMPRETDVHTRFIYFPNPLYLDLFSINKYKLPYKYYASIILIILYDY